MLVLAPVTGVTPQKQNIIHKVLLMENFYNYLYNYTNYKNFYVYNLSNTVNFIFEIFERKLYEYTYLMKHLKKFPVHDIFWFLMQLLCQESLLF